jgi:Family of unknown function (DUF5706)
MRVLKHMRRNGMPGADLLRAMDLPDRAWKLFDIVNIRIEHADVKAATILGGCGVTAAALLGLITGRPGHDVILLATAAVSGAFDLASAAFCCGVLWPRRLRGKLPESLIYFDHLARRPNLTETFQQLRSLLEDPESLSGEIIKQVLATSRVASMKYDLLDRAMLFFFAALVSLAATASIFALHRAGHWL